MPDDRPDFTLSLEEDKLKPGLGTSHCVRRGMQISKTKNDGERFNSSRRLIDRHFCIRRITARAAPLSPH